MSWQVEGLGFRPGVLSGLHGHLTLALKLFHTIVRLIVNLFYHSAHGKQCIDRSDSRSCNNGDRY